MNYKTHMIGGGLSGLLISSVFNLDASSTLFVIGASSIGGLLPDIDHENSKIGRRFPLLSKITSKTLKHRGPTHSPIVLTLFFVLFTLFLDGFLPLGRVFNFLMLSFYIGSLSHVFLDMFNRMGVPLLYPISKRYTSLGRIRVNSKSEGILRLSLAVLFIYLFFKNFF